MVVVPVDATTNFSGFRKQLFVFIYYFFFFVCETRCLITEKLHFTRALISLMEKSNLDVVVGRERAK